MVLQKAWSLILLAVLSLLNSALHAQRGNPQYVYRNWDNQSGLPQNTVTDILTDRDGYLWAATEDGLVRFDGASFTAYTEANTPGLHSNTFFDLSRAGADTWAASRNTVLRIHKAGMQAFDFRKYLEGDWIRCVEADGAGRVWVGTSLGQLFYIAADSIHTLSGWNPRDVRSIDALQVVPGGLAIGTGAGLFQIRGSAVRPAPVAAFNGIAITALAPAPTGDLWVGTVEEGLYRYGRQPAHYTVKDGLKEPFINSLAVAPDGALWIGTRSSGFQVFTGGRFTVPDQKNYAADGIKSILVTPSQTVWLGTTSSGLLQMKPAQVQVLPQASPLAASVILPVYQHASGDTWLGTAGKGLSRIAGRDTTTFTTANGLSNNLVLSVYGTGDAVYIGTANGLDRFSYRTGRIDRHFTKADGLDNNTIQCLFYDSHQRLWMSTRAGGIQVLQGGQRITRVALPAAVAHIRFLSVFEDRAGNLWFGSRGGGALRLDGQGRFTHFTGKTGFPADIVFSFHEDRDGTLWMATDKGLVSHNKGGTRLYDKASGLRFTEIYRVLEDGAGYLWLSGNHGLQRVALADLKGNKKGLLRTRLFNTADGMTNAETNGGIFPAGWKMQDGSLWFPTVQGVAIIDPGHIREDTAPVTIALQAVRFANKELNPFAPVRIPPGAYNLQIHYTSIDFSKADEINYQYRLKGLNNVWIDGGNQRTAYYSGLAPGDYHFEVRAERYGKWSPVAVLPFTLEARFYQTLWFKGLLLLLALSIGLWALWLQKRRGQQRLEQQRQVTKAQITGQEKERQVIGTELHDNINQQLTTAKLYLDMARTNEGMRLPMVAKSEQVVHNVINEIRALCKSLIPPTLKDIGLKEALAELIDSYKVLNQFTLHFSCPAPLETLEEDLQFSLFRITQEQLTNIAKHAGATNAWVSFRQTNHQLLLIIKDDGKGFQPKAKPGGMGLTNIRQRLELYNGHMSIQSAPQEGCVLKISIPLSPDSRKETQKSFQSA
jgi:signal transduction histidine kinase/ligand-binding sensor domain-containing protein